MKFLTILFVFAIVFSLAIAKDKNSNENKVENGHENKGKNGHENKGKNSQENKGVNVDPLTRFNSTVQTLLAVSNPTDLTHDIRYFWDLLNPVLRYILLNQTQVSALPFDITQQLQISVDNLNWTNLPADVQTALLDQTPSIVINLTFLQWGFVDAANAFASSTVYSLLPANVQNILPIVYILLDPIYFDLEIDLTDLNQILVAANNLSYRRESGNLVKKFLESFTDLCVGFLPERRSQRSSFRQRKVRAPTAASTLSNALERAERFVRTLNIKY